MRLRRLLGNDQLLLGLLAVVIGLTVGGAVIGFREAIGLIQSLFFGTGSERLYRAAAQLPWWQLLLAPAVGGLAVGVLVRRSMPDGRTQGLAHVIEAAAMKGGRMSLRAGLLAALGSATAIGVGASVGREGPAVHLGGTLAGWLASVLHLGRNLSRAVLGCGVAAAVAASFNAPIAGALFAHEVVVGHYALSAFAPVVIASVTATLLSRSWFGDFPAFTVPDFAMKSVLEFPAFAGLGIVSALLAVLFMRAIVLAETRFAALPIPAETRPALAGLLVGVIAIWFPQILGVGYEITDDALQGSLPFALLLVLLLFKLIATAASLGGGFPGGVFGPSLVLGALLGGAYGTIAIAAFPAWASPPGAYALVGMGAVAAAVMGAPISTTLIMFELTGDYQVTVAVMVAAVIANVLSHQIIGAPSFFHWQLARRGLDLAGGLEARLLKTMKVRDVVKWDAVAVPMGMRLAELRARLQATRHGELFVVDTDGTLVGTITLANLADAAFDPSLDDLVNAIDVARLSPPAVALDDDFAAALDSMLGLHEDHLAVVDSHDTMVLKGWVHQADLLVAYNRALMDARSDERGKRGKRLF